MSRVIKSVAVAIAAVGIHFKVTVNTEQQPDAPAQTVQRREPDPRRFDPERKEGPRLATVYQSADEPQGLEAVISRARNWIKPSDDNPPISAKRAAELIERSYPANQ
ncbi:hypothetical protein NRB36_004300 [Salmonella enterica]|nr:hypothetical protein [Salmonella enterica]EJO1639659.1 hypothetical protein [Salmonella enterica]